MNGFAGVMLEEGTTRRKLHRMLLVASAVVFSLSVLGIAISSHIAILADNIPLPIVSAVFWSFVTVLTCVGMYASYKQSYPQLVWYMHAIVAVIPILLTIVVACYAFNPAMEAYVHHHWDAESMHKFRHMFCKGGTADYECKAPAGGGPDFNSTTSWCMAGCPEYGEIGGTLLCEPGSTDCEDIVADAQGDAKLWLHLRLYSMGVGGAVSIVVLVFGTYACIRLLTVPVVMQKLLLIVNFEAVLPVVACAMVSAYIFETGHDTYGLEWVGYLFAILSVYIAVLACIGVVAGEKKSRPLLTLYCVLDVLLVLLCLATCIGCWAFTTEFDADYSSKSTEEVQELACDGNFRGCCCCDEDVDRVCPEWDRHEVLDMVRTVLQVFGFIAFAVIFFMGIGLVGAFSWINSLKGYQTQAI